MRRGKLLKQLRIGAQYLWYVGEIRQKGRLNGILGTNEESRVMILLLLAVTAVIAFFCWLGYRDAVWGMAGRFLAFYSALEELLLKFTEKFEYVGSIVI